MSQPTNLQEQVLVTRAQAGDETAFQELVEEYSPRLRYYLRGILSSNSVDDVLQEVWMVVHREFTKLRTPTAFRSWLYRIAKSRACRERRVRSPALIDDGENVIDETNGDQDFSVRDAVDIHAALKKLTPEHREVLLLRFMESMSYDEIACVLAINVGTIRSRIHYGKQALKKLLEYDNDRT